MKTKAVTNKTFEGVYMHKSSKTVIHYVCRYHYTPLGVAYEADAGFENGKTTRLVTGVVVWGFRAIVPRRSLDRVVRESIDIIDIEKFKYRVTSTEE